MDKKTMLRVFGEAFLRSLVALMAIAILGFAAFFVIKVNADKQETANHTTEATTYAVSTEEFSEEMTIEETEELTTEEVTTEEVTTEAPVISSKDKSILVLNSTGVAGLAMSWTNKLTGEGYAQVKTGNYSLSSEAKTRIIVSEEGMGADLAEYFNDAIVEVGTLTSGVDVATDGVEVFIILGTDDSTVQ